MLIFCLRNSPSWNVWSFWDDSTSPDHCRDVVVGEIHLFILKSIQVPFSLPISVQADDIPIQKQPTCSMYEICMGNCTQNYPDMIYHTWIYMEHMGPKLCGNLGRRLHQSYTRIVELNTGINMDYSAQNVVNLCNSCFFLIYCIECDILWPI